MNNSENLSNKIATSPNSCYMQSFKNILNLPSMLKEYKPKVVQKFDIYLDPNELKHHVLKRDRLQNLIDLFRTKYANVLNPEKRAAEIINEIALQRNLLLIRCLGICITQISKKLYSGIYVNENSIVKVKSLIGNQPVLYLPNHRSYCDFILLSYICFHYDIEIPGIAAGMDFYSMSIIGNMLRKTGAFFMRRSFSEDEFYWDVFKEYMLALISEYHIGVEFFIEGTRSRNFKALLPKVGLLSMALQPLFVGDVPDILVIPISISYDRLLEEQLFVYELLGVPKPKESTKGFLKALKIIEQRFGQIYLDFGEPISAKKFFGDNLNRIKHANISMHLQKLDSNDIIIIKKLANEVAYHQQKNTVITIFNLVSVYYLYRLYIHREISIEQLYNGVLLLKKFIVYLGGHAAVEEDSLKNDLFDSIEVHSNIMKISGNNVLLVNTINNLNKINYTELKAHQLCNQIMQTSITSLSLQLYVNPCMFWLLIPSVMVLCALKLADENVKNSGHFQKEELSAYVNNLFKIFVIEYVIILSNEVFEKNLSCLNHFNVFRITNNIQFYKNEISELLLSTIAPFLCIYLQVAETILEQFQNKDFTEKELNEEVQKRVENLLLHRKQHVHPYCLALTNINFALSSYVQNGYLIKRRQNKIFVYKCYKNGLLQLRNDLLQYSSFMSFNYYFSNNVISKL